MASISDVPIYKANADNGHDNRDCGKSTEKTGPDDIGHKEEHQRYERKLSDRANDK